MQDVLFETRIAIGLSPQGRRIRYMLLYLDMIVEPVVTWRPSHTSGAQ